MPGMHCSLPEPKTGLQMSSAAIVMKTKQPRPVSQAVTGLDFNKVNNEAGSDIRIVWDLFPRVGHTVIWRYYPRPGAGLVAVAWSEPHDGGWDSGVFSFGTHPYPSPDGVVDGNGEVQNLGGPTGTVRYWEVAGAGLARDWLCTPGGAGGLQVVHNAWYTQIRRTRFLGGGVWECRFIPDFIGNPGFEIVRQTTQDPGSPANHAFYFGASKWAGVAGGATVESTNGIICGPQLYGAYLSDADAATEAANSALNTAQTSAGQAALYYINQNWTPTDTTDKKTGGTAHNPYWDNANRPSLYTAP